VIPIAALEQHGPHMPVFTDSLLLGEIVRRTESALADRVLFSPLMWLGNSEHHIDFAGTMTASPRTYLDLLKEMSGNFVTHGFRRIVLLNGHGGNIVPSQQALFELRQQHRNRDDLLLLSATYWQLGTATTDPDPSFSQTAMGHACEWETSMMLALRPELVGDYRSQPAVSQARKYAPANQAWTTRDLSEQGYIGDPAVATAEKGKKLFDRFSADVIAMLERI
jgi:creatinine amidohydrolase